MNLIFSLAVVAGLNAAKISAEPKTVNTASDAKSEDLSSLSHEEKQKQIKKRNKLIRQIEELEVKQQNGEEMSPDQLAKLARKGTILDRDANFALFWRTSFYIGFIENLTETYF